MRLRDIYLSRKESIKDFKYEIYRRSFLDRYKDYRRLFEIKVIVIYSLFKSLN